MLRAVVAGGTGRGANPGRQQRENRHQPGFPRGTLAMPATGSQVWMGNDDNSPMSALPAVDTCSAVARLYARGVAGPAGSCCRRHRLPRCLQVGRGPNPNWLKQNAETSAERSDDQINVNRSVPVQTVSSRCDLASKNQQVKQKQHHRPIQNTVQASGMTVPFKKLAATIPGVRQKTFADSSASTLRRLPS